MCVLALSVPAMGMGMMEGGCQNCADVTGLAGLWTIQRGEIEVRVTFTTASGGEQETTMNQAALGPLDANDFPAELADFVAQWNANLDEVEMALEQALPDQVVVTFPNECVAMRLTDPNDATSVANGIIGQMLNYAFVGGLAGGGQQGMNGGGTLALVVASVEGSFDQSALTTTGQIVRRLAVLVSGNNNSGLSFVVAVAVNYTGERTGDVP